MATKESFGGRLERLIAERGISKRRVEVLAKTSKGYVSRLIGGTRPDPRGGTIDRIAAVLDVDPLYLMTGRGSSGVVRKETAEDACEARVKAARAARELGYSEQAIQEVQGMTVVTMAPDEWLDEMRSAERRIRRGAK